MRRTRFKDWPCSVARVVDLLGDWWTPLIIREAFYGVRRFDEFQNRLGISRNVLTERLARLTAEGVLKKAQYNLHPPRHEYRLTRAGTAFFDVIVTMMRWGDDHLAGDEGPPIELVDRETGRVVRPVVVDETTGTRIDPFRVQARMGPGFPARHRARAEREGRFTLPNEKEPTAGE